MSEDKKKHPKYPELDKGDYHPWEIKLDEHYGAPRLKDINEELGKDWLIIRTGNYNNPYNVIHIPTKSRTVCVGIANLKLAKYLTTGEDLKDHSVFRVQEYSVNAVLMSNDKLVKEAKKWLAELKKRELNSEEVDKWLTLEHEIDRRENLGEIEKGLYVR